MKEKNEYFVIGIMSGTSGDGLDLALCQFNLLREKWEWQIIQTETIPYDEYWSATLNHCESKPGKELMQLHAEYGQWIGTKAANFIEKTGKAPDLIASHGHTVFHDPYKKLSFQLGYGLSIFQGTDIPVVTDFRQLDVLLGGQGAPLVPIGDDLLFSDYDFCLNLGGIANASFKVDDIRYAYDVAPCNVLLNHFALQSGVPYDQGGVIARGGKLSHDIFEALNAHEYYQHATPKSLDRSYVLDTFLPLINTADLTTADALCTLCHHIAHQIGNAVKALKKDEIEVLITGGGAYNDFLVHKIKDELPSQSKIKIPDPVIIEYKEALVFAFLGMLKHRGRINTLASATGASRNSSGGVIYN